MSTATTALMQIPQLPRLQRILVIQNDRATQAPLQQLFESEGYGLEIVNPGTESEKLLRDAPPSLLILDLQMGDTPPRRLFEQVRFVNPNVPIIVLGVSSSVKERVLLLELGADDYIVKPFNGRELLARVRATMRRSLGYSGDIIAFGDVQVDFRRMEVRRHGGLVSFTAQEFKVLKFMTCNAERAFSREQLLNEVWGYHNYPTTRTVDNHILRLRQKLERHPSNPVHFLTVYRVGYKFAPHSDGKYWGKSRS